MPAQPFVNLDSLDPTKLIADHQAVCQVNPQRFEFALLDGVMVMDTDAGVIAGYRDVRAEEFWVKAHIPGRPLFPGVLMIETAAQLVSYYVMKLYPEKGFLGFGGVDDVKFRGAVVPGQRLIMLGKMVDDRPRRVVGATQGFVDGKMVYEGTITGMWI